MSPGKVGETFEIFTSPSSNWWTWNRAKDKEKRTEAIPASPPRVHKVKTRKWAVATIWGRRPMVEMARELKMEGGLRDLFSRTKGFVNGIWMRVFGV